MATSAKARKFGTGLGAAINKQNTNHGKKDLPYASLNSLAGKREGGTIMAKDKGKKLPPWLMKKGADDEGGGKAPPFGKKFAEGGAIKGFAKGGGIESRGKTKGKMC